MAERHEASVHERAGKYLTFVLGDEVYGIEILKAQEIVGMMKVTRVPRTPLFVRGVINLRGKVFPVIDLRKKFGLDPKEDTQKTCIIVVNATHDDRQVTMGIVVDAVSEVLNIPAEQIEPTPEFGIMVNTDFILGLGKQHDRVVILLDVDKVLSQGEIESADQAARTSTSEGSVES
jgi:purine-binding chemotaxis protein CheW